MSGERDVLGALLAADVALSNAKLDQRRPEGVATLDAYCALLRELREALALLGTGGAMIAVVGAAEHMAVASPWSGFADMAVGLERLAALMERGEAR